MSEASDNIVKIADKRAKAKAGGSTGGAGAPPAPDGRPVVEIRGGALAENMKEVEKLLIAAGEPMIFQRRTKLVNIIALPETKTIDDVKRTAGSPMINVLTPEVMRRRMDEVICFMRYDGRVKALVPKDPPDDYAAVMLRSVGLWNFAPLHAIIETPTLRADGSILQVPGYDPATCLYYKPAIEFPLIPEAPTRDDAYKAFDAVRLLYKDFPFEGRNMAENWQAADVLKNESVAIATTLTALVRHSLNLAPMTLFDAPTPASGKTLAANVTLPS